MTKAQILGGSAIRKPLYKCFVHILREVNPEMAQSIEDTPRIRHPDHRKNVRQWRQFVTNYASKVCACNEDSCVSPEKGKMQNMQNSTCVSNFKQVHAT